jgi:hypothetical protein
LICETLAVFTSPFTGCALPRRSVFTISLPQGFEDPFQVTTMKSPINRSAWISSLMFALPWAVPHRETFASRPPPNLSLRRKISSSTAKSSSGLRLYLVNGPPPRAPNQLEKKAKEINEKFDQTQCRFARHFFDVRAALGSFADDSVCPNLALNRGGERAYTRASTCSLRRHRC